MKASYHFHQKYILQTAVTARSDLQKDRAITLLCGQWRIQKAYRAVFQLEFIMLTRAHGCVITLLPGSGAR
jgi:hypothetical protein